MRCFLLLWPRCHDSCALEQHVVEARKHVQHRAAEAVSLTHTSSQHPPAPLQQLSGQQALPQHVPEQHCPWQQLSNATGPARSHLARHGRPGSGHCRVPGPDNLSSLVRLLHITSCHDLILK